MPFPEEDLEITLRAAFGANLDASPDTWSWTDLSSRVVRNQQITINRGVLVGGRTARTSSAGVQLTNPDGWLTPHHAGSPWWPNVDAGTPIDLSVRTQTAPLATDTFTRTVASGWGNADSPAALPWTFNNTSAHSTTGSTAQVTFSATNITRRARLAIDHRDIDMVSDFTMGALATGAAVTSGHYFRGDAAVTEWLWSALDFATSGVVSLRLRNGLTDIVAAPVPGLTYTGGTKIRLRTLAVGNRIRIKAWLASAPEPGGWHLDHTVSVLTGAGTHVGCLSWVLSGNTNTLPYTMSFDDLTVSQPRYPRIEGYIADVRPTFSPTSGGETWSTVQVDIGGVGTRLERLSADPWSPMRRSTRQNQVPPVAYWPLEDSERATTAASAIIGQPSLQVLGPAVFEFDTSIPEESLLQKWGTKRLTSVAAGARLATSFTPSTNSSGWTVSIMADWYTRDILPAVTEARAIEWGSAGTFGRWALIGTATGHVVRAYNETAGTTTDVVTSVNIFGSTLIHYDIRAAQNGSNIDVALFMNGGLLASGSVAGTLGAVSRVAVNPDRVNTTASTSAFGIRFTVGHVAVRDQAIIGLPYYYVGTELYRADEGWWREPAHLRVQRQCDEERLPFRLAATPTVQGSTKLNTQQEGTFGDLIQAAADAESGAMLYEAGFGYELLPRSCRYNQPVALSVDLAAFKRTSDLSQEEVLVPQLDLRAPNTWTVERTGGSQATAAASAAFRKRRGTIADKATLDLLQDSDTGPHARWRVHLVEDAAGANYPTAPLDLAANPELIDDWLICTFGSRMQRTGQPTIAGTGIIDQVIEGITETIGPRMWIATPDTSPAVVWQVGVYDAESRYDSQSTTITAGKAATSVGAVEAWVVSTVLPPDVWDTTAVPLVWLVGGEQVTVTAITAPSGSGPWTQTATVTRGTNGIVRPHTAGEEVHLASPARYAL